MGWLKRLCVCWTPLTAAERAMYQQLAAQPYAVSLEWVQDHCKVDYKLTISNRGVQRWIAENAKRISTDHELT